MRKLDHILVVLDPQEEEQPALERAIYLAERAGARLHLFMCAYDVAVGIASFLTGGQKHNLERTLIQGNEVLVERLAEKARALGIDVTAEVLWERHPVEAILRKCREMEFDLIMKRARHQNRTDAMFNHLDLNLMRYAPAAVMLVKDGQWDDVGQVLAAVDAAPEDPLHEQLNRSVLEHAGLLSELLDFELHLVSAYPAPPVYAPVSVAVQSQVNYRVKMRTMVEQHLMELGGRYAIPAERIHAIEGPVDWVVPHVSEELVAEFVVMGNVSREGLTGISLGSTAESTLDTLNTNVLMVRLSETPA